MKKMEKISILSDGSILYLSDNNEILITLDELKDATGRVDLYELYLNLRLSFSKEKSIFSLYKELRKAFHAPQKVF